ncbi:hypothetical protein N0S44_000104 [Escherichia coli]|nr:hypothetical protein [Escherichia coli]EJR1978954.1 hypothetical protein [Escherichia coli]
MQIYKGWKAYKPNRTEENANGIDAGALFIQDENGNDWYDFMKSHADRKDFYVLVDEVTSVVIGYGYSVVETFPIEMTLCIVEDINELPDGFLENPKYFELKNDKIVSSNVLKKVELGYALEYELDWVNSEISVLADAELFEDPEDLPPIQERLLKLRRYRYELSKVDPEVTPDYVIPARP